MNGKPAAGRDGYLRLRASLHWLRHTFAKAQLLGGIDIRQVASAMGHASADTTMADTDQGALDLIRGMGGAQPGVLAATADAIKEAHTVGSHAHT